MFPPNFFLGYLVHPIFLLQGKIFWLKFAWNGIQTFIADVSVKQPFSRQFAITMRQIKINLKRKFGFHEITSIESQKFKQNKKNIKKKFKSLSV